MDAEAMDTSEDEKSFTWKLKGCEGHIPSIHVNRSGNPNADVAVVNGRRVYVLGSAGAVTKVVEFLEPVQSAAFGPSDGTLWVAVHPGRVRLVKYEETNGAVLRPDASDGVCSSMIAPGIPKITSLHVDYHGMIHIFGPGAYVCADETWMSDETQREHEAEYSGTRQSPFVRVTFRASLSRKNVETEAIAEFLFREAENIELIGDVLGRVWREDAHCAARMGNLDISEPVRCIFTLKEGIWIIGTHGSAKFFSTVENKERTAFVPPPFSVPCSLSLTDKQSSAVYASHGKLINLSASGEVLQFDLPNRLVDVQQTKSGIYFCYDTSRVEKVTPARLAQLTSTSNAVLRSRALKRIGTLLAVIENFSKETAEVERQSEVLSEKLSRVNVACQMNQQGGTFCAELKVATTTLANTTGKSPNVILHVYLKNTSDINFGGAGWFLNVTLETERGAQAANFSCRFLCVEAGKSSHVGDHPFRLKFLDTPIRVAACLTFHEPKTKSGNAGPPPAIYRLRDEVIDGWDLLCHSSRDQEHTQSSSFVTYVKFMAVQESILREFLETQLPVLTAQTEKWAKSVSLTTCEGDGILVDLDFGTERGNSCCTLSLSGSLPIAAMLRAGLLRRIVLNYGGVVHEAEKPSRFQLPDQLANAMQDLWTIHREADSGMLAAVKDEKSTLREVRNGILNLYLQKRSGSTTIFELFPRKPNG